MLDSVSVSCFVVHCFGSICSFAIILKGKRELVVLFCYYSWCLLIAIVRYGRKHRRLNEVFAHMRNTQESHVLASIIMTNAIRKLGNNAIKI